MLFVLWILVKKAFKISEIQSLATVPEGSAIIVRDYTVSQKETRHISHPQVPQMLTDFQNYFTVRLSGKFATNSNLNIPPHLMSLHYLVKYECQKTSGNLKYVLWLMINYEIAQPSIQVVMSCFIINLSFNLLVKIFFKSANAWRSYRQSGWSCHTPCSP